VTDFPESAIRHCAEVMFRQYESEYNADHLTWRDFAGDARAILDAAAADLGEHAAARILAHMEGHGPPGGHGSASRLLAWRRHFSAAARVASRAFLTEDDEKRLAAEAIARGDYAVCDTPEVPGD
jgi:hypothetical protein